MKPAGWAALTALSALSLAAAPGTAAATGFTDLGDDLHARPDSWLSFSGAFRVRGEADGNFDLDRGLTPAGDALFFVPLADPNGQTLARADLRLRTDLAIYAPFGGVALKLRADLLDNLTLGSTPDGAPASSSTQLSPVKLMRIKRAYLEVMTPVGLLTAGRTGSHWGLGMLSNGGDCLDCDSGDAADRVALITPLGGWIWALAYDFGLSGPSAPMKDSNRAIDLQPSASVHTVSLAVMDWRTPLARERRREAGRTSFEYGALASYRWQKDDVPAEYLPLAAPVAIDAAQVVPRDYSAGAFDAWLRLTTPWLLVEAEAALLLARVGQPSLIPGVLLRDPVTSRQVGAALSSEIGGEGDSAWFGGLDLGYASGDPELSIAAVPQPGAAPVPPNGAVNVVRRIVHLDQFRFHPDFRIDRILFHEIIGAVADAVYARPHARWRIAEVGSGGALEASLAAVGSLAAVPASTPTGQAPLGIEIDPTLAYRTQDGFVASLEYALLFPLAGLGALAPGAGATPAQQLRLLIAYQFRGTP
jgi:uncharacterized protein (TIGR04551 family)